MGRCNILAQLEALEQTGLITTVARDVSGRLIHFPKGIENDTRIENGTRAENDAVPRTTPDEEAAVSEKDPTEDNK
jgi:hypothetical protein